MDIFFEQIVKVKRTGAQTAGVVGIIALLIVLMVVFGFLFMMGFSLSILLAFGACWGAYKLITLSSIEYEYIYTNGDLDIDKITARASRKRVVSILCSKVERYGQYNPAVRPSDSVKKVYTLCDVDDPNAKYIIAPNKKEGLVMIVFAPDERMRGVIEKAIPRIAQ